MKWRELVFDLDGTLSNPALGIARSMSYALRASGLEPVSEDAISEHIGPPIDEAFRKLAPDAGERRIRELVIRFRERYAEVGYAENVLYPGVTEALDYLVGHGLRLGVCTTKRVDFAEQILELFRIRNCFQFVSGGDVGIHKREQLEALLAERAMSKSAAMIGDRAVDVLAARANGLGSVGVLWGFGTRVELVEARAELLLSAPNELIKLAAADVNDLWQRQPR